MTKPRADEPIEQVIARSSLGRPGVRQLAARAPESRVRLIISNADRKTLPRRDVSLSSAPTAGSGAATGAAPETAGNKPAGGASEMPGKRTSPKAAKAASKVLRDGRTGKASKTAAGSALSQRSKGTTRKGKR